ncbi:MAG: rRNA maturation RNase YbeY [Planctomycetes bacterium]|nr:rRNA maturation RNase YbeY [Planctomycetota bacterium]
MSARPAAEVSWSVGGARLLSDAEVCAAVSAALAHGGRPGLTLAVVFVADAELARLHAEHLGDPSPTDVLAFDLGEEGDGPAGEVYVSVERARAVARERDLAPDAELLLYVVHGCLHLCGHDDHAPRARARMRAAERAVLALLGSARR